MKKYNKITTGFVVQEYEKDEYGKFVCVKQEFVASDEVNYENENGEPVEVDTTLDPYQSFEMVQPFRYPKT